MAKVRVPRHKRRGGKAKRWLIVKTYSRKKVPKGSARLIGSKAVKLYPIKDEYGHVLGWSRKPGRKTRKSFGRYGGRRHSIREEREQGRLDFQDYLRAPESIKEKIKEDLGTDTPGAMDFRKLRRRGLVYVRSFP